MKNNDLKDTTPVENFGVNIQISTNEETLKTDGVVEIGFRDSDNTYKLKENILPESIDINKRIQIKKAMINEQNKKAQVSKTLTKEAKKVQNIVAIVVLMLFIAISGFFLYQKYFANNKNFTVKNIHVEFGEAPSLHIADYINIKNPDEKDYILDLSSFIPDKIGKYKYRIKYKGIVKEGVIEVSDTKAPNVTIQEVKLNIGDTFTPEMFIKECHDYGSCIVTFEDGSAIKTATEAGIKQIALNIKDTAGNQISKQATLNVKSTDILLVCEKNSNFDYSLGYKILENYDVYFSKEYLYKSSIYGKSFIYIDNNEYIKFKNENKDGYIFDDNLSKVTKKESYNNGFGMEESYEGIKNYLEWQGYSCQLKNIL